MKRFTARSNEQCVKGIQVSSNSMKTPDAVLNRSTQKTRLLGIELGRGLSTYAVVLVHSGDETWGLPIDDSAIAFRFFFYFAVPFFLATAFYFMTTKSDIGYSLKFWKSRIERIVIPYVAWSAIFFISRLLIFSVNNKSDRLQKMLQDPVSIIFFGGASYQLYFLPLLLTGTTLILLVPLLEKLKVRVSTFVGLSVFSTLIYYLVDSSGNSFRLDKYVAFQELANSLQIDLQYHPLLRCALVIASWMIRCLPYFLIALVLNKLAQNSKTLLFKVHPVVWMALFLLFDLGLKIVLPGAFVELCLAFTLLVFCISLSNRVSSNHRTDHIVAKIIVNGGACSFGIYLCHPFLMNLVKSLISKVLPELMASVSIASMLFISTLCFFASWLVVAYLSRNKFLSKYLLGT